MEGRPAVDAVAWSETGHSGVETGHNCSRLFWQFLDLKLGHAIWYTYEHLRSRRAECNWLREFERQRRDAGELKIPRRPAVGRWHGRRPATAQVIGRSSPVGTGAGFWRIGEKVAIG